jgi:hypothetical protein
MVGEYHGTQLEQKEVEVLYKIEDQLGRPVHNIETAELDTACFASCD